MTFDASSRKDVRRLEKESARIDKERQTVIYQIMDTTTGREYIWNELSAAHVFQTCFSSDPLQMAFLEGERNAGLRLMADIMENCPDLFIQMMRESNDRERARQQSGSPNGNGSVGGSEADSAGDTLYDTGDSLNDTGDTLYDTGDDIYRDYRN
jgi:hypothetical protein